MNIQAPFENYTFQKDGILVLLLPFKKRKHHKALKPLSAFNRKPTEGMLNYLLRHQPAASGKPKGDLLVGHMPTTPYGNCLTLFPRITKLNKLNIKRAPLLVIADNEMGKADFYTISNDDIQPMQLSVIKSKAFITRFATDKPCIVWIKPGIKIKTVIQGFYLHEANSSEIIKFPQFSLEQLVQLTKRNN
jgi:hypothetical protein